MHFALWLLQIVVAIAGWELGRWLYRRRHRERDQFEDVSPFEFVHRAEAMQLHHDRLLRKVHSFGDEAEAALRAGDLEEARRLTEKMDALKRESLLILNNIGELRLEQLACQLDGWRRPKAPKVEAPI